MKGDRCKKKKDKFSLFMKNHSLTCLQCQDCKKLKTCNRMNALETGAMILWDNSTKPLYNIPSDNIICGWYEKGNDNE